MTLFYLYIQSVTCVQTPPVIFCIGNYDKAIALESGWTPCSHVLWDNNYNKALQFGHQSCSTCYYRIKDNYNKTLSELCYNRVLNRMCHIQCCGYVIMYCTIASLQNVSVTRAALIVLLLNLMVHGVSSMLENPRVAVVLYLTNGGGGRTG